MQKRNMIFFALIVAVLCIGMSTISAADMADVNATAIASENAIDDVATIEDAPEQDIEVVTSEQNNLGNEVYTNENSLGMVEDSQSDDLQSTTRTSVTVSNGDDLKNYCEQTSDYEITSTASSVQLLGLANPFSNDKLQEETPSVIYVNAEGDDSNDGLTADTAVKTIAKAVELSATEGTIIIAEGEYAGEEIHFYDKKLTIMGVNCENTIIAGDIKFIRDGQLELGQGYSFDGFLHLYNITFKNLQVYIDANATFENCIFDNADFISQIGYPMIEVSGEVWIDYRDYIFIDIKNSVFLNHENGDSYFNFDSEVMNIEMLEMMPLYVPAAKDVIEENPIFNVNNCYFNADVLNSRVLVNINNCIVPTIVDSDSVVYDGETLNDFTVKLVSVNAEGVESDFDATGFPSIPVTFTVDGVATESAFVDGIAKLSVPLTTDQAVIKATVGDKVLTFTLPKIINDDNYADYFDEEGNFVYEIEDGATVLLDTLTNKNMIFSQPLNIKSKDDSSVITNGTITLTADASGSVIDGLTFDYTGASNLITLADGISDVTVSNNIIKFNSTGRYAAAIAAANWEYGPISNMKIVSNKIDVICENAAAYAIDVAGGWGQKTVTDSLISQNNITIQANGMAEAIYVCSASNFNITENNITATSEAGASYGIAADNSDNIGITGNTIDSTSKQAAYGIANTHNADNTISDNKITVEGASAIGVGVGFDTGSVIEGNTIDVNASDDYASTPTSDYALGTGNSGIKLTNNATATISNNFVSSNGAQMDLDGASADTNVGTNYVAMTGNPEDVLSPVATTISVASATVTADPNGAGKTRNIAITVKDANGKAVADQTLKVYVNGALKTVKTNADGVATLAVAYKAAGTTTLVASFDGATGVLGSSAVGKLTVKKNAVKIAAKTKKVKKSKAKKAKVQITVKAGKTALKKKLVTITINKKTYKAKTNAKGIATFKVKLPKKAKKYKYTVKFAGDNFNNAKTFKGKLTVK